MARGVDSAIYQQVVAGLSEGVILVGLDRTLISANPAALAMHGVAELGALGATVGEYRDNFVLRYRHHQEIGPLQHPLERVLSGETMHDTVVEVRKARDPERVWLHRIRSVVTTDPAGTLTGLALVMQDVSERYEAEARFDRMFGANPAPAVICRIADLRYVKVNQGFLDLTGYDRVDVLGRTFMEVDVLHRAERRALALERLHAGRTIRQMEACLSVPADGEKHVIVAGHPIEMPGSEPCMLFTFADLEDRCRAEQALKLSEERFAKAFELSPIPTAMMSVDGLSMTSANAAFVAAFAGSGDADGAPSLGSLAIWLDLDQRRRFLRELKRLGSIRGYEASLRDARGGEIDGLISADTVTINGEACILLAVQDITARRRSESELIAAIEAVMADASWFSRGVIDKLALLRNPPRPGRPVTQESLTLREEDMLASICRGDTDAEISADLGLSRHTVRNHVANLYRKLGVNRRSAVIVWARERGIGQDHASRQDAPKSR